MVYQLPMSDELFWKNGPTPVYAHDPFPTKITKTLFLAGPSPRGNSSVKSWRGEAMAILQRLGFNGHVFIPEASDGVWKKDYDGQVEWEEEGLHRSDLVVFWVPRSSDLPGLTTNIEWGRWYESGKVIWGSPDDAAHTSYPKYYAKKLKIQQATTLEDTLKLAIDRLGEGSEREGGEVTVPLHIWDRPEFMDWYWAQLTAGNLLTGARVVSSYPSGPNPFCFTLHVNVYVKNEDRQKTEMVFFRSDTASVLLYHKGATLETTSIVLVREFRCAARNAECFVYELPGGSSKDPLADQHEVALAEVEEETGFRPDPSRLELVDQRQLVSTLSSHHGYLFRYALNDAEMKTLDDMKGIAHGVKGDSERTFVEVRYLQEILEESLVDWSTLGMILSGLKA